MTSSSSSAGDRFERGMAVRRQVLGDEHVDRSIANTTALDAGFQRWITESAWGELWADDTLDHRTRSMITLAILAALGSDELELHLRASTNTGVSDEDLAQVMMHVAIYAGVPAANSAIAAAKRIRPPASEETS